MLLHSDSDLAKLLLVNFHPDSTLVMLLVDLHLVMLLVDLNMVVLVN